MATTGQTSSVLLHNGVRAAAIVFAMLVIGVFVWRWDRSEHGSEGVSPSAEIVLSREQQYQRWSEAEYIVLAGDRLSPVPAAALQKRLLEAIKDPAHILSAGQSASLTSILGKQALARSQPTGDAYVALAESGCSRWVEPRDTHQWGVIKQFAEQGLKRPFAPGQEREMLAAVARYCMESLRGEYRAVGVGERGASIAIFTVRSEVELMARMMPANEAEASQWYGSTHGGFMLRMPLRSFREVLASDGIVTCANVLLVVETPELHRYTWHSTWFWDPRSSCWACHQMSRTGGKFGHLMFY